MKGREGESSQSETAGKSNTCRTPDVSTVTILRKILEKKYGRAAADTCPAGHTLACPPLFMSFCLPACLCKTVCFSFNTSNTFCVEQRGYFKTFVTEAAGQTGKAK